MRLKSYRIENYKSVKDTGVVELSLHDNISVLAGQNESGKSSVLRALRDFESDSFDIDAVPYSTEQTPPQRVTCEFLVEDSDDLSDLLTEQLKDEYDLELDEDEQILDTRKIGKIKSFSITREAVGEGKTKTFLDDVSFNILRSAILNKKPALEAASDAEEEAHLTFSDEENADVASIFWRLAPTIVFFDDFCDLLPDKIYISDLKEKNTRKVKGYRAVQNLQTILGADFVAKDEEKDSIRKTKEEAENKKVSINFQKDWGQRIYDENEVKIIYDFQKRAGEGEEGSYVNFFVETKPGELLSPKQRSKGLVWFLSLWLELQAQDDTHQDLILLLDEPDQHLHVKAQQDILKLFEKLATNGDQVVYATHSPYLIDTEHLNRVNLVVNSKELGTTVNSVLTTPIDTTKKVDALQPISDAIGLHTVSALSPVGNKRVILEGISDFNYFVAMRELLGRTTDYSFLPGIGVRKTENLISFCIGNGFNWLAVIDADPADGGRDSMNKFDEIKEHVFDGSEEETRKKVHVLEGVVGIENMFTMGDLKQVDMQVRPQEDKVLVVGKKRKVLFSKLFLEKVRSGEITDQTLSKTAIGKFKKVFDFLDKNI